MPKSVYFTSLRIGNVRCFGAEQELDLRAGEQPAQWTLILGDNGAGKTALLQSLAWMRPVNDDPPLLAEENEVLERLVSVKRSGDLRLNAEFSVGGTLSSTEDTAGRVVSQVESLYKNLSLQFNGDGKLSGHETESWPEIYDNCLVVAYGANRQRGVQNLDKHDLVDPIGTRLSGLTELYDVEEMLRGLDYASLQQPKGRAGVDLSRLKEVLTTILPEKPNVTDIQIFAPDSLNRGERSGVYIETFSGLVQWSQLSLGYQATFAWVADFAWRLLKEFPCSETPFNEPAVVLLDEIDLHLHPRWQHGIMADLSKIFPGTQFVATTHSPLMAQVAEGANFVLLNKREEDVEIVNDPEVVRSWRVDQILTSDLFGMSDRRSPKTEEMFTRRDALIAKQDRSEDEEAELGQLRIEIENLPTAEFPDDRRAMESIRRAAELLNKRQAAKE